MEKATMTPGEKIATAWVKGEWTRQGIADAIDISIATYRAAIKARIVERLEWRMSNDDALKEAISIVEEVFDEAKE